MNLRRRWLGPLAVGACALVIAGCGTNANSGGGNGDPTETESDAHFPRQSSVGNGISPAPPIAASVRRAAAKAGCTVRAFPPERAQYEPDGTLHTETEPTYHQSIPPASGLHYYVWADWGVYDKKVPYRFQVHNLEHGGVIIHLGKGLSEEQRQAIEDLWRDEPAYLLVVPEDDERFPAKGVVLVSWQRWLSCKPFDPAKHIPAMRTYIETYRGTGPEYAPATNSGEGDATEGLPQPRLRDPDA